MKTLPRSGFQLGWVRVAVRIAATNKPPTAARVREMAEAIPSVSSLTYETGLLPKSGFREPGDSSQVLGFSEKARCTDLGHALGLAERWSHADDPFTHSPAVRWVLWYSSGTTAATFWRAAFEALPAVDDPVKWFLATRNLLGSRGQISSLELDDFNYHGQPWLGQAKNLGWSFNALQSLRQWVGQSSDPWTHGDIWRAFQIAEGLSSRPATPDDLRALLLDLPPELLGFDRQEATVSTVQLCGVARGLAAGELQDWYGEPWRALMRDASALGVYEKAGAQALSPNLAWDTERLKPTAAPPSPPPGLPPLPEALPPATLAPVLAEADQRARSWMRAMAWWARGPHAADILLHGHDSWRLLHSTLEHWLQPAEKDRWQGRTAHVHTVPWLKKTVNRFAAVVPGHACRVLVDDTVDHETRALAFRKVPREIEFPALVGTWLDDGEGHWAEVEQASVVWAAHCVERHLWSRDDLVAGLKQAREGTAAEVQRLLVSLTQRTMRTWSVEGRLAVAGELDALPTDLGLTRHQDPIPPFEVVIFERDVEASSPQLASILAIRQARDALLQAAPGVRVLTPTQPERIADEDGNPVPLDTIAPPVDGDALGSWWTTDAWFRRARPQTPRLGPNEQVEFEKSRLQETAVDRLLGLWVTLEAPFDDGASGRPVLEQLAQASVPAILQALNQAAVEIGGLMGTTSPAPNSWRGLFPWLQEVLNSVHCTWATHRLSALQQALTGHEDFTQLRQDAIAHAMSVFSTLFSIRNRRVHEAWRGEAADEVMLLRLDEALSALLPALLRNREAVETESTSTASYRWTALGGLLATIKTEGKKGRPARQGEPTPSAFLDELGVLV